MSTPAFETYLARLYTDQDALERFLAHAADEARRAGLNEDEIAALRRCDRTGLMMAAASYRRKRQKHKPIAGQIFGRFWRRLRAFLF